MALRTPPVPTHDAGFLSYRSCLNDAGLNLELRNHGFGAVHLGIEGHSGVEDCRLLIFLNDPMCGLQD